MSPEDSGRRRQNQGRQAGCFLCSSAEISKARAGAGEVNFSSRSFNTLFLLGLKCLKAEWGKKKSGGREQKAPSFLMRNTRKKESVFLSVSGSVPQLPKSQEGQKGREAEGMTRNPLETHSVGS